FRDDPSLKETARLLHESRPDTPANPFFRNRLRGQLMVEAARRERPSSQRVRAPRPPWWLRLGPGHLAWAGAAVGTALIAATAVTLVAQRPQDHRTVVASSTLTAQHLVSPNDVITISFNQPMNESAVVTGLHIQPATEVTTSWNGSNLVITPVHHLAGNTPYTVTIAKRALISASGSTAPAPVAITFGTAPTPPPTTSPTPPLLQVATAGSAETGSSVLFAPDGSVVSTDGSAPAGTSASTPSPAAAPSASATPSPTPSASATASTTAATPNPAPTTGPALIDLHSAPVGAAILGPPASAAAFAPDGSALAAAVADGHGGSQILASQPDGTQPAVLADISSPVVALTWTSNSHIEFATRTAVEAVTLGGDTPQTLASPGAPIGQLAAGGATAYLEAVSGQSGQLLDVASGSTHSLHGAGAGASVAFSGDGTTVAWVDTSGAQAQLMAGPIGHDGGAALSVLDPGTALSSLALNDDGSRIAYTETPQNGSARLVLAQVPSGAPLATGPAAVAPSFSADGATLALLVAAHGGFDVDTATIPNANPVQQQQSSAAAQYTLHQFVDAQAARRTSTLQALSGRSIDATALTPDGLSRAYIIDSVAQPDGSLNATAALIVDPTATRFTTLVTDETLTITPSANGGSPLVTALTVPALRQQASGPHVVQVSTATTGATRAVLVSFDSDLSAATAAGAIRVQDSAGATLPTSVTYDADSRTATVTLASAVTGHLSVVVGTGLQDINGQPLAAAFSATV
ncbi:MAG: Ig-like domain-containing protein, partial [Candidatus Dormibacteraeota bacterium]|nr:Ig-like domain-containing protein [Candidatus Dormibacteraeota bacterium]